MCTLFKILLFFTSLSLFFALYTFADTSQSEKIKKMEFNAHFDHMSIKHGLSRNTGNAILLDSRGFLWIGTENGLNRYDGYTFKIYKHDAGDSNSLSNDFVTDICEDQSGDLWIGTRGGINKFNRKNNNFTSLKSTSPNADILKNIAILDICRIADTLWIATLDGGLFRYEQNNETLTRYTSDFFRLSLPFFAKLDSLKAQNKVIAAITKVRNNQDSTISFNIAHQTKALIVCIGEGTKGKLHDYGQINGPQMSWKMDQQRTYHFGGTIKNRIQTDLIDLVPGTYTLKYHSDDSHAFSSWNEASPPMPEQYGIQLLALSNADEKTVQQVLQPALYLTLPHKNNFCLYKALKSRLWIGTAGGFCRYDAKENRFISSRQDDRIPLPLKNNAIQTICQTRDGDLWFAVPNNGIYRLDSKGRVSHHLIKPNDPGSFSYNDVPALLEDQQGILWVGTDGGGLYIFSRPGNRFIPFQRDPGNPFSISHNYIRTIYNDANGILWIGTWGGGINKFDRNRISFKTLLNHPQNKNSIGHNRILDIFEDEKKNIWIGLDGGGLDKYDQSTGKFYHYQYDINQPNSPSSNFVTSIQQDRDGNIWFGTWGGGINQLNPSTKELKHYFPSQGKPQAVNNYTIHEIYIDKNQKIWIATFGGGVDIFDIPGKIFSRPAQGDLKNCIVTDIAQVSDDMFWFSTWQNGLYQYICSKNSIIKLPVDPDNPEKLRSEKISTIFIDSNGTRWVGTYDKGIARYNPKDQTFHHFSVEDGLPDNSVFSILEDDFGNLWFSTDNGLCKFNHHDQLYKTFNVHDGLQSNRFTLNAACKCSNGLFYFGSVNGLLVFYPQKTDRNMHIPPIAITDMKIKGATLLPGKSGPLQQAITETNQINLKYHQNSFSFEFVALDLTAPLKNRYAYQLKGLEADWHYTSADRRYVNYTELKPGKYVFKVRGSNNDGIWNKKGASVSINISPPFWQTWPSKIILIFLILGGCHYYFRNRVKNIRMKTELRTAHNAQMSIMPQFDPKISGLDISGRCLPANQVGGDFFDYFWLNRDKSRFGIAIGDVSGKAMESAMTAVLTDGMIYLKAVESSSISDTLGLVNRSLYEKTDKKIFIALCLVCFDIQNKTMTFSNAGLEEPLLKSGNKITALKSKGAKLPLGSVAEIRYESTQRQLKSGDVIFFITDGIVEAQNASKAFFSHDNLKKCISGLNTEQLSAMQIKDKLLMNIQHFVGNTSQFDDMTIVVVKVD